MTTLEKLAQASYERKVGREYTWQLATEGIRDTWRSAVRAVLTEIQEPIANPIFMAILCMKREGLGATGEYNGLWSALASLTGEDEIKMRRETEEMQQGRRRHSSRTGC